MLFEHLARRGRLINVGATAGYKTVGYADIHIPDFIVKVFKQKFFFQSLNCCKFKLHYGARTLIGFLVFDYKSKYGEYCQQLSHCYESKQIIIKCDLGQNSSKGLFKGLEGVYEGIKVWIL
jgi:hypothetical protein